MNCEEIGAICEEQGLSEEQCVSEYPECFGEGEGEGGAEGGAEEGLSLIHI